MEVPSDRCDLRVEARAYYLRRAALVAGAHDRELSHVRLSVGLALTERADRLLDLLGVLDQVRTKAMQPEAHVHGKQLLHRCPLRGACELRGVGVGERGIRLRASSCQRPRHRQATTGGIGGIGFRPALRREHEWLAVLTK